MKIKLKPAKLRKYTKLAKKVQKLAPKYQAMTDAQLQAQTAHLREQLAQGKKLVQLLPDAYAVVVEANKRVLGLEPYFVQIIGGVALFFGNVAEMKTGEGKTLTATMPLYLHALTGAGNFLITANAYLAWRDAEETGRVYRWLGLNVAVGVPKDESEELIDQEQVYQAEIIYTTHSALGFDYLFTNLAVEATEQYVTAFNYALIDEIDAILLDMAQTPLIVSGAPKVQSNLYESSDWFIKSLTPQDYQVSPDKKSVWFTKKGIQKAENFFNVAPILSAKWQDLYRHLMLALRANHVMLRDRHYVVAHDEVLLLDEVNGRKLIGTKLQAGLHQAIEAKEQVTITDETKSMGSITYQNLFKKFAVLSGMTGTASTDSEEFRETYQLDVVVIPTNQPIVRQDHPDEVYISNEAKVRRSLVEVKTAWEIGRPVLIETGSVAMSDLYSLLLLQEKIPHNLLNATTVAKESWIISEAGRKHAVTVATSMAGRGTDIKLDEEAKALGGLLVVGTERMTSERIDNQLRGRAGRQGDPGDTQFFVSMEDKIVIESAPKWVVADRRKFESSDTNETNADIMQERLQKRRYRRLVTRAQNNRKNEEMMLRKNILEYDEIIGIQRDEIYATRDKVMRATPAELTQWIEKSMAQALETFVCEKANLHPQTVMAFIHNTIDYNFAQEQLNTLSDYKKASVRTFLAALAKQRVQVIQNIFEEEFQQTYFKRLILLKAIDMTWIDQADHLQQLKTIINSRSWGQHRPIYEYQLEARRSFDEMREEIWLATMKNYLLSELLYNPDGTMEVDFP